MSDVQYEKYQFLFKFCDYNAEKNSFETFLVLIAMHITFERNSIYILMSKAEENWMWKKIPNENIFCRADCRFKLCFKWIENNEQWNLNQIQLKLWRVQTHTHWYGLQVRGVTLINNYHRMQHKVAHSLSIQMSHINYTQSRTHTHKHISNIVFPFSVWIFCFVRLNRYSDC